MKILFHLLTCMFIICMNFFLLLNTKEDILKNVGNQSVDGSVTSIVFFFHTMEVGGYRQPKQVLIFIFRWT